MIYVLELEWRGEKAVLVIEIALQNIFLDVSCLILYVAYSSLCWKGWKVLQFTFEIRKICHCSESAFIF